MFELVFINKQQWKLKRKISFKGFRQLIKCTSNIHFNFTVVSFTNLVISKTWIIDFRLTFMWIFARLDWWNGVWQRTTGNNQHKKLHSILISGDKFMRNVEKEREKEIRKCEGNAFLLWQKWRSFYGLKDLLNK